MKDINEITAEIIDAAIKVHSRLGPGLFESVYEQTLSYELTKRGLYCDRQVVMPVIYDDMVMQSGFKIDIMVEGLVIIELKSVETIAPVHKKQVLTYLRLADLKVGLLINFNEKLLKNGITRLVNNYA